MRDKPVFIQCAGAMVDKAMHRRYRIDFGGLGRWLSPSSCPWLTIFVPFVRREHGIAEAEKWILS